MRDRGITFVNAPALLEPNIAEQLGTDPQNVQSFIGRANLNGTLGPSWGTPASTGAQVNIGQYERFPNQRIITVLNLASSQSNLETDVPHEIIHGAGVPGADPIKGIFTASHDLSIYGFDYNRVINQCRSFGK